MIVVEEILGKLKELEIDYVIVEHEPLFCMDDCEEIDKKLGVEPIKNLFLKGKNTGLFYMVIVKGNDKINFKDLSLIIGEKISFASEENMLNKIDCNLGSVSIAGIFNNHENDIVIVLDNELLNLEYFAFHPCCNTKSVRITTSDLTNKLLPYFNNKIIYTDIK